MIIIYFFIIITAVIYFFPRHLKEEREERVGGCGWKQEELGTRWSERRVENGLYKTHQSCSLKKKNRLALRSPHTLRF